MRGIKERERRENKRGEGEKRERRRKRKECGMREGSVVRERGKREGERQGSVGDEGRGKSEGVEIETRHAQVVYLSTE